MVSEIIKISLSIFAVISFVMINALILVYMERKVSARIQLRYGPQYVGWNGIFQTFADAIKLLTKEPITPSKADKKLFILAPIIVFMPVIGAFLVIPFSPLFPIQDLNIGLLLIFAFSGITFVGIFMAGWASNNKYSLLGAMRSVAQNISYEIPLLFSVMGIILLAGSLKLSVIVQAQKEVWFILYQPIAFLIFFISALAESNRAPFDIPEAESELVAGFHTEFSGMRFGIFFISEYTYIFINACLGTALFLGGWQGPYLPAPVWFLLKTYLIIFIVMWVRWTFPRLRSDQLISFAWKVLIPISLLNVMITAVAAYLLKA